MEWLLLGLGTFALGAAAAWIARSFEIRALREASEARLAGERAAAEARREGDRGALEARIEQEREASREKAELLEQARERLSDAFRALSAEALQSQSRSFLELARASLERFQEGARGDLTQRQVAIADLVTPVKESLGKLEGRLRELETARVGAYSELREQVRSLGEAQGQLRLEAANLVKALRSPVVRGRWGEIQLRRVVEMAGMQDHCDFFEQAHADSEAGRLRPDLLVKLPGGKHVVVDAKAPLAAYLEAMEAPDDVSRRGHLAAHARHIRDHVAALSRKAYWDQFQPAPEFVVLFLPGESFFSAALEEDPTLIEAGIDRNVILATPTTLIALLRAVSYGWRQEALADNARAISELGRELHSRLSVLGGHMGRLGKSLSGAVEAYNKTVATLETRVLVSARRFKDLGAAGQNEEIVPLEGVEQAPRFLQAPELESQPSLLPPARKAGT